MAVTDPRTNERRRAKEATIRVIDLVVYVFAFAGGVFALTVTPDSIRRQLEGFEWIGIAWGVLLVVAGTLGFTGRLTRFWLPEVVGAVFAITGELIYLVILGATAFTSATAWVAISMITGAMLALVRRYIELQIFTTDPEVQSLAERLEAALRRRTTNVAGEHR
jgi:hypothetical protein